MIVYIDSSAVLRVLFDHNGAYKKFGHWTAAGSSELLVVECNRTMHRLRLENKITDEILSDYQAAVSDFLDTIDLIEINRTVIEKSAGPFPTIIGSLDAIHLTSALMWKEVREEEIYLLTHDMQLTVAARAMGLRVLQ